MAKNGHAAGTPRGAASWEQTEEMNTVGDMKRFLAFLIQQVRKNKISVKKANCLAHISNVMINAIVDHELEERIAALEISRPVGQPGRYGTGAMVIHERGAA